MPEETKKFNYRLSKAAKEFNMGKEAIVKFLTKKGFQIDSAPNTKLTAEMYTLLVKEYQSEKEVKNEAKKLGNLSYKGGGVSVESTIKTQKVITDNHIKDKTDTIAKKERREKSIAKVVEKKVEKKEKSIKNKKQTKVEYNAAFSELKFEQGHISLIYDKKYYIYRNYKIEDYNKILEQIYSKLSKESIDTIKTSIIKVIIDLVLGTFVFKDIYIRRYINHLKEFYLPENKSEKQGNKIQKKEEKKSVTGPTNEQNKSVKQGNRIQKKEEKKSAAEPTNEQNKNEKEIHSILLRQLNFGSNYISIKLKPFEFVLWENGISHYLNSEKSIKNTSTKILLDYSNQTFQFTDSSVLSHLKDLSTYLEKEAKEDEKTKKIFKTKVEHRVTFSALKFGEGLVSIIYNKRRYIYKDPNIRNYDKILNQVYGKLSKTRRRPIKSTLVKVLIDTETETFTFNDIDICNYVNYLKNTFLTEKNQVETLNKEPSKSKSVSQMSSSALMTMTIGAGNIRFYNGYYLIFQTNNGEVDNTVNPYRVDDPNSHEILNLVHKYFEQKLEEKHIIVKLDDAKIVEPSKFELFQLKNYVRYLNQNLDEKGGWWKEVQNYRKPSLKQCRSISAEVAKKKVSLKNSYLDSLVSMQSEIELIPVYEINNHGKKEAAFIFSINMPNNRRAVIFENVSNDAATATWVFVTKIGNYEPCINLVFDYFTDYTIFKKRFSLRLKTVNPPEKFKAENYIFIDHDDLRQWLKKLNTILEQAPEPSEIQFVPGLHIPKSSETRKGHNEAIATKHLHNQLIRKLYDKLCNKYGEANVGTENRVGTKRIDVVVKGDGYYDIYEVKTAENAYDCVQEALGQLFIYTVLSCHSNIRKMVVVGMSEAPKEFEQYLSTQRKSNSLQFYYMKV